MESSRIIEHPLYRSTFVTSYTDNGLIGSQGSTDMLFITVHTDTKQVRLVGVYVTDSLKDACDSFIKAANQAVSFQPT